MRSSASGSPSDERALRAEPEIRPRSGRDRLEDAVARRVAFAHADDRVAQLMDAPQRLIVGGVGDPLAVDVLCSPPHAVLLAVEAEVERGAEIKARFADPLDLDGTRLAVEH